MHRLHNPMHHVQSKENSWCSVTNILIFVCIWFIVYSVVNLQVSSVNEYAQRKRYSVFSDEVFVPYQHIDVIEGCLPHAGDIVEAASLAVSNFACDFVNGFFT